MSEEQNLQQETNTETPEAGSEEEALQALAKAKGVVEQPEINESENSEEQEAEAEPEEQDEGETDDENTEEEPPQLEFEEVEINGKTYSIPVEIKDGYLRQSEFSKKMNEVSEVQKSAESKLKSAELMNEAAEVFAESYAKVINLQAKLKDFESYDWQALRRDNPAEYAALSADYRGVEIDLQKQIDATKAVFEDVSTKKSEIHKTKRDEMLKALQKSIPKWSDDLGMEITKYAVNNGFSVEDLQEVTHPKYVESIYKAMLYDKLMKTKERIKDKIRSVSPVLKPSSTKPANARNDALDVFKKNRNSTDAAVAALSAGRNQQRS